MLKKTVKYEDFDENTREETLYFHISKTELTDMELKTPGGLANKLQNISSASGAEIMDLFKEIILRAYGEKAETESGQVLFIKKKNGVALRDNFEQSLAFDALFSELLTDPDKAAAFVNGVLPNDLVEKARKEEAKLSSLPSEDK